MEHDTELWIRFSFRFDDFLARKLSKTARTARAVINKVPDWALRRVSEKVRLEESQVKAMLAARKRRRHD